MGTWAEGNFDNDTAMDFVGDISDEVAKEISPPKVVEDIDLVMAAVAVRMALVEHCCAPLPDRPQIETLKAATLAIYDEQIDSLEPGPDHKAARRRVITETFDKFLDLLANESRQ